MENTSVSVVPDPPMRKSLSNHRRVDDSHGRTRGLIGGDQSTAGRVPRTLTPEYRDFVEDSMRRVGASTTGRADALVRVGRQWSPMFLENTALAGNVVRNGRLNARSYAMKLNGKAPASQRWLGIPRCEPIQEIVCMGDRTHPARSTRFDRFGVVCQEMRLKDVSSWHVGFLTAAANVLSSWPEWAR